MAYTEIAKSLILGGKELVETLFTLVRSDFEDIETRILALEASAEEIPPGVIIPRGVSTPSVGFLACDGTAVSRGNYAALFAVCGTTYGIGDGSTTFNLPDLRGRVPIGSGTGTHADAVNKALGASVGAETHTLVTAELASHSHTVNDAGHSHTYPRAHNNTAGSPPGFDGYFWNLTYNSDVNANGTGSPTNSTTTGITVDSAGGGGSHNNMQPSLVCGFFIKT